jgi:hypothetical protein
MNDMYASTSGRRFVHKWINNISPVQTGTRKKYISTNNPKGRASQKKRAHEKIATPSTKITNAQSLQIDQLRTIG